MKKLCWVLAVAFAVARFFIPTHPPSPAGTYEALAHIFVGLLIGAGMDRTRRYCWLIAAAISAVELAAFLLKA